MMKKRGIMLGGQGRGKGRFRAPEGIAPPEPEKKKEPRCVCLTEETLDRLAEKIEQRLLTSKGIRVTAPTTCTQPSTAEDVDVIAYKQAPPAGVGDRITLLSFRADRVAVIKGLGISYDSTGAATEAPEDFWASQLKVNGQLVHPYQEIYPRFATGVLALGALQIVLRPQDLLTLEVEKLATPVNSWLLSARIKGWQFEPTSDSGRNSDLIAY